MIHSLRKSRFLVRRSRKANIPARSRVSLADFNSRRRPPTKPLAALKIRFLAWLRAAPLVTRIGLSQFDPGTRKGEISPRSTRRSRRGKPRKEIQKARERRTNQFVVF